MWIFAIDCVEYNTDYLWLLLKILVDNLPSLKSLTDIIFFCVLQSIRIIPGKRVSTTVDCENLEFYGEYERMSRGRRVHSAGLLGDICPLYQPQSIFTHISTLKYTETTCLQTILLQVPSNVKEFWFHFNIVDVCFGFKSNS